MKSNYELWKEPTALHDDNRTACELDTYDIEDGQERHRKISEIKRKQKAAWWLNSMRFCTVNASCLIYFDLKGLNDYGT